MKQSRLGGRFVKLKMSYPQGTEDVSVEAADLAGSIIQGQYLGVTVAVAIIGYLQAAEARLLRPTRKTVSPFQEST